MNDAIDFSSSLIIYKGKSFPFRVVWSNDYQSYVIISVTSLNDVIFDRHDCWVDDKVEMGKSNEQKIDVPVLFGKDNTIDKSFYADALSNDGRIVIEVEAGQAT